jgi:SAM-dependent methyltransferase
MKLLEQPEFPGFHLQHSNGETNVDPMTQCLYRGIYNQLQHPELGIQYGMVLVWDEKIKQYDPFFHKYPELLNEKYDYIASCEVVEHFHYPDKEFELLKKLLLPNGMLFCMTDIYNPTIDFANWYYKNDPTHVFIYQKETFEWIKTTFNFSDLTIDKRLVSFYY